MGNGNIPRRNKSVKSALRSMRRDGSMSANDQKSATVKHMKEIEEAENDMRKYRQRGQAILAASIAAAFADSDIRGYLNRQITNPAILTVIEPARALRFEFNQSLWNPIQTIPKDTLVDLWIKSSNNEDYGRRLCNVSLTIQGRFTGDNLPVEEFGEYASHWMPSPKGPV